MTSYNGFDITIPSFLNRLKYIKRYSIYWKSERGGAYEVNRE
jgi:hypothetical protein